VTYSHPDSLRRQVFIVTGAARGIGRGIAEAVLERGASVLLVDMSDKHLAATTDEFRATGYAAEQLVADLRNDDAPGRIVAAAIERFGAIHGLVNNAMATKEPKPFTDISGTDFHLDYQVGPRATFFLMQAVYPAFAEAGGGSIVNLGSGSGTGGEPGWAAYAGAKEAIRGMSKVAALEWGRHGVRVNVVCPFAESDGVKLWREFAPEDYQKAVKKVPLQRIGDPRTDVGALVAFLLSDDASFITAQTIHIDGGTGSFR
jgi:NAD(P)-dependent dehydrogenase (short-subunit alcohol dehydrogenase family)